MRSILVLAALSTLSLTSVAQITLCEQHGDTIYVGTNNRGVVFHTGNYYVIAHAPDIDAAGMNKIDHWAARGTGVEDLADSCIAYLKPMYTQHFTELLAKKPAEFNGIMNGQPNVSLGKICFFGMDGSRARLIEVIVYMNKGIKHPVVVSFSKKEQPSVLIGHTQRPVVQTFGNRGLSMIGWLKKSLAFCSGRDRNGPEADAPIDVLVVSRNGGVWTRQ